MNTIEKYNKYVMKSYGRLPLALAGRGKHSASAVGEDGKLYIDFGSGIGVNSLGFCDSEWAGAVCKQAVLLQHNSNYYYNKPGADFSEKLCEITGYTNMFLGNSGAEANECAIKLSRKYSFDKYGKNRHTIITLVNSFHGRTLAALSATGQEDMHNYFFPFVEGFVHVKANDIAELKAKLDDSVCAVMFEYIQGEGGVEELEQSYVDEIFRLCSERDILTIADEVQTGAGRTGKFLVGEHYGKQADITTLAKGIGGGLPLGICLANEKCAGVLTAGTHGSTYGGNPVVLAGATAVLNKVSAPGFLSEILKKGEYIREKLAVLDEVVSISGKGLMLGITLNEKKAADILEAALEKGLLTLTAKEKLRLLPPLVIDYESLDKGLEILAEVLS
ncbi:MAG: acetylornithine transaminase [Oscillospiraceae bacterium]|jgi:acetylornithine/N-succinyldiaminopimelate aminotransferase|nr:acetylornithine transaminase [Oscillospiraceae bacterium]